MAHVNLLIKQVLFKKFLGIIFMPFYFFANSQQSSLDTTANSLTIVAQFRPRAEIRSGAFRPLIKGEHPSQLISERIRLTLDYGYKDILTARISPQTVGIWGQSNMMQGIENDGNKIALFEAWAQLKLSKDWSLKLGRQVISLDDERFFGELDWAQGGRAHDALSVHFQRKQWELKGFAAFNQNYKLLYGNNINNPSGNLYNTSNAFPYKEMLTFWTSYKLNNCTQISLLAANIGFQNTNSANTDTAVNYSHTIGLHATHSQKKNSFSFSLYYQFGKNNAGQKTSAYLLAIFNSYQLNKNWNIGLGSDLLSGNNIGNVQLKNNAFNPLFHTGHKFYGNMDYYFVGNGHKNAGISDSYFRLNYKSKNESVFSLTFHQFFAPVTIANSTFGYSANLGQEADILFQKKLNKFAHITGGYSFYITTPTLLMLKNISNASKIQHWFWLGINITPTILKLKFTP